MNRHIRRAMGAAFAVLIAAAALCFNALSVSAQPFVWNPPCAQTIVRNNTGCNVTLNFKQQPNFSILPITLPPFSSAPLNIPAGTVIMGVIAQSNTTVALIQPGPPIPLGLAPTFAWARGVTTGPDGCCVDVYFDNSGSPNCIIWIFPGTPPCTL